MINVENKKLIAYKNERTKKIAFNLRKLIIKTAMEKWSQLGRSQQNKNTKEYIKIEDERSDLYRALDASICICPCCNQANRDMVFNAPLKEWYCAQCVEEYHTFYHKNKVVLDQGGFVGDFNEEFYKTFL